MKKLLSLITLCTLTTGVSLFAQPRFGFNVPSSGARPAYTVPTATTSVGPVKMGPATVPGAQKLGESVISEVKAFEAAEVAPAVPVPHRY